MINNEKVNYKGGQISKIVIDSLKSILNKVKLLGIKKSIENFIPGIDADNFVILKIKNQLAKRRSIELTHGLGRVDVQYRNDGIQIEFFGLVRYFIKQITISNQQIIKSFDDILNQIQENYIVDDNYIIQKIDDIIFHLSDTEIYKPKNSEDKTFYDLAMLILLNYYNNMNEIPHWIEPAIKNIGKGKFIEKWIEILAKYISEVITTVSEDIFFDFKVTFESVIVRSFLNKKTNKGQISRLLSLFDINIKDIIYKFVSNYVSPSFIRGASEILADIAGNMLSDCSENLKGHMINECENVISGAFNITMSFGKDVNCDRSFRWFTSSFVNNSFLEYSYFSDFSESYKIKSNFEKIPITYPILNLGLVSNYKISYLNKHSVVLKNLTVGIVYYRIICDEKYTSDAYKFEIKKSQNNFKFMILADSQGMVKSDYDIFLNMLECAVKREKNIDFLVHLGDFVDDGNNEEYWKWVLSSNVWRENVIVPLAGNHEARISAIAYKFGVNNSIMNHFNLQNIPPQDTCFGAYYSFVYGDVTFIVLNTNTGNELGLSRAQYRWVLKVSQNAKTKWKILLTHKSPYSNEPHHKDADVKNISRQIIDLVYTGEIDLVFGGHDHVYIRTPFLNQDNEIKVRLGNIVFKGNKYVVYNVPYGTMFVVPGTSGVKNYKQYFPIDFLASKILNVKNPIYSTVEFSDSNLYFNSYEFDTAKSVFNLIDSFAVSKDSNVEEEHFNASLVSRYIDSLPDVPWKDNTNAIGKAFRMYKTLEYSEKIKVNGYARLLCISKMNANYQKTRDMEIRIVKNKEEFLLAIKDSDVGTIVVRCDEISFANKFSFGSKIIINRALCITGDAKLMQVSFILKKNAFLILSGKICLDNTRKQFSLYPSNNGFVLYDNAVFILNEDATINGGYGVGRGGYGINMIGENASVYLNSSGHNFVNKGIIFSNNKSSKIVVTSGKYLCSRGQYAFNFNGTLKIKAGFIRSIRGYSDSIATISGGIIGEDNKLEFSIPIESYGIINLEGGTIYSREGISIFMHDKTKSNVRLISDSVDIKGEILYN